MDLQDLEKMTEEFGEGWALPHTRRLLKLVDLIGAGRTYDHEALTYAIYLHDWGAFSRFKRAGVGHGLRSREVAEKEILPHTSLNAEQKKNVLDMIEYHDYRCVLPVWTEEALLLREADFLDFLGMIGIVREFSWAPGAMKKALERILSRRAAIQGHFTIPAAQKLAAERLERMEMALAWLNEESFGEL
jgi:uncharacterized protein